MVHLFANLNFQLLLSHLGFVFRGSVNPKWPLIRAVRLGRDILIIMTMSIDFPMPYFVVERHNKTNGVFFFRTINTYT